MGSRDLNSDPTTYVASVFPLSQLHEIIQKGETVLDKAGMFIFFSPVSIGWLDGWFFKQDLIYPRLALIQGWP